MKRLRLLLIVMAFGIGLASEAQQWFDYETGSVQPFPENTMPEREVELMANGNIKVTYVFPGATIIRYDSTNKGCYWWKLGGFGQEASSTNPAVPVRLDSFYVPDGKVARIDSIVVETFTPNFYYSIPNGVLPPLEDSSTSNINNTSDRSISEEYCNEENSASIDASGIVMPYPLRHVQISRTLNYRNSKVVDIIVHPIQVYGSSLQIAKKLSYIVKFSDIDSNDGRYKVNRIEHLRGASMDLYISGTVDPFNSGVGGGGGVGSGPGSGSDSDSPLYPVNYNTNLSYTFITADCTYAILTTDALKPATEEFAEWKKMQGYNVVTLSAPSWTYETAKAAVDNLCEQDPDFYHLLIVGGAPDVPGKLVTDYPENINIPFFSDYYFSVDEESDAYLPSITVGRIPFSNTTDVANVLHKIREVEKNPSSNTLSTKLTSVAYFPDIDSDGYEDRRFTQTANEICEYADAFVDTQRIFKAEASVNPTNWSRPPYSFGEAIPEYLLRPNFLWDGGPDNIISSINSGTSILAFRGNGTPTSWSDMTLPSSVVSALTNTKLPIVYSIACSTGDYSASTNLATAFLKPRQYGSHCVIASTTLIPSILSDEFAEALINAHWPNPGLLPRFAIPTGAVEPQRIAVNTVGEIFQQALKRSGERFGVAFGNYYKILKEGFHLFGDPTMYVNTESLVSANSFATIKRMGLSTGPYTTEKPTLLKVSSSRNVFIGLYNSETGETKRFYGQSLVFDSGDLENWSVTVYEANVIPMINQNNDNSGPLNHDFPGLLSASYDIANSTCVVSLDFGDVEKDAVYSLEVRDSFGNLVGRQSGTGNEIERVSINSNLGGIHTVSLISDGAIVGSKQFIK